MFKRVVWFGVGAATGLGSSVWVQRRVKRAAARYVPENVQREVSARARRLGADVRDAAAEGRAAMRQHEAFLRAEAASRAGGQPAAEPKSKPPRLDGSGRTDNPSAVVIPPSGRGTRRR